MMREGPRRSRACGVALLLCVGGCTGHIGNAGGGSDGLANGAANRTGTGSTGSQGSSSNPDCVLSPGPECATEKQPESGAMNTVTTNVPDLSVISKCSPTTERGADRESLRRLTKKQLLRSTQAAFPSRFQYQGNDVDNYYQPNHDVMASYPSDVGGDITETFNPMHSEAQIGAWLDIADETALFVAGSSTERRRYGSDCMAGNTPTTDCWRGFVTSLGRNLWRRPLSSEEVDTLVSQVPTGDAATAVQTLTLRMMTSPHMMFLVETGTTTTDGKRVRLSDYEVAARLSYALTDSPPDQALFEAADAGQLKTLTQVETHAARLIASDLGKSRLKQFVFDWMRADTIGDPIEAQGWYRENLVYNGWKGKAVGLAKAFQQEIADYFNYVVFSKKGTFRDLMTLAVSFPNELRLGAIYGTGTTTADKPVSTPDHPGLLTRVGVLASTTNEPPTIRRGVTVKRRFLCDVLPSPDFAIVGSRLQALQAMDPVKVSNHDMVATVTSPANCQACHSQINPIGFGLETFSPIGIKEAKQNYIADDGHNGPQLLASFDLPGPQKANITGTDVTINGPSDLTSALGDSNNARACLVTRFFRAVQARSETESDACALSEPTTLLSQDGSLLDGLVRAIVNEDIFWRKAQ
jgi:hypothetical protein